jgi:hypothetical protein
MPFLVVSGDQRLFSTSFHGHPIDSMEIDNGCDETIETGFARIEEKIVTEKVVNVKLGHDGH